MIITLVAVQAEGQRHVSKIGSDDTALRKKKKGDHHAVCSLYVVTVQGVSKM